jgi:hypothetical protein
MNGLNFMNYYSKETGLSFAEKTILKNKILLCETLTWNILYTA